MGKLDKISVALDEKLGEYIRRAVESGDYSSPEAVAAQALQLWQQQRERDIQRLRELVAEGLASGPSEPWEGVEAIKAEGRERLKKLRAG